jgi:drug/metabolite transporter (DMT)-like permease
MIFSWAYLGAPPSWNHLLGFSFICLGAFFIFHRW